MKNNCPFLEQMRRPHSESDYGCGAGINFYPIGENREYCQICTVATLGRLPDCQYLDVHAWLNIERGIPVSVEVQPYCTRFGYYLSSDLHRCARCPERRPQAADLARTAPDPTRAE